MEGRARVAREHPFICERGGEADGGATAWVRTVAGWEWATVARGDAENNDMLSAWLVRYEADWAIQAMWRRDRARG